MPGLSTADHFTISVVKAGVTTDVVIDLTNVTGPLTLDNINAYVNQQLSSAGFATRFTRVQTGGASSSAHFAVYDFIGQIVHSHPLLGLGLNNFSVYYEFVTGKTNWGPHSFWVALIVETGLVGLLLGPAIVHAYLHAVG